MPIGGEDVEAGPRRVGRHVLAVAVHGATGCRLWPVARAAGHDEETARTMQQSTPAEVPPTQGLDGTDAVPLDLDSIVRTVTATDWSGWGWLLGKMLAAVAIGLVVHAIVFAAARRLARRTDHALDDRLAARLRRPSMLIFPLLALLVPSRCRCCAT
jgi:hypothetical protein